ncbi:MAG: hypothetical protein V2J55_11720, partial [Candidatus Competibacteraceae bacterium]|nr:hypothetical protein [Candidatus Competibacteraceae bacterium]
MVGEYGVNDFPAAGNDITLRWSEPQQNFVLVSAVDIPDNPPTNLPRTFLESPAQGSFESGIGLIRGWVCEANQVEVSIDGGPLRQTAYGTKRGDTVSVCGDDNNGFGLTFNWNAIGDGVHNLRALADGVEFASVNFAVTTLGVDFLAGVSVEQTLPAFPNDGETTTVRWSEPQQNFTIVSTTATGAKIATAAAITDLLNPYLVAALGANQSNNLGVQVIKGADGQPTQLTAVTWGDLEQNLFANLLLANNGLPMTYRDSVGFEVRFGNFTQTTVEINVFDNNGMLLSGPITLPINFELLFPLQQLAMGFQNPFQSAQVNVQSLKHVHMAAAARAPFSLDPLRLETLWAGGIATAEVLCALQPVMANGNTLV